MKIVTFRLRQEQYGLPVEMVTAIERVVDLRPIPLAPPQILGLINLRGEVITVIDMRRLLNMPEMPVTEESRLLIIDNVAYLVDAADDVREMEEKDLEMVQGEGQMIRGVWRDRDQLVIILAPDTLRASITA